MYLYIKNKLKLWVIAREVPKLLEIFEGTLRDGRSGCNNEIKENLKGSIQSYEKYMSILISHIYSDGKWKIPLKNEYKKIEPLIVESLFEAYNKGKKNNIRCYLKWLLPEITDKLQPIKIAEHTESARGDYGQLQKIANLLQHILLINDSNLENSFNKYYGKKLRYKIGLPDFMDALLSAYSQVITDIKQFQKKHDINISNEEEMLCFYNIANFYIHNLVMTGVAVPTKNKRELFWAVSLLHPIQDKLIDEHSLSNSELECIAEHLSTGKTRCKTKRLVPLFKLINIIYKKLPIDEHPKLRQIFLSLQKVQVKSIRQKKGSAKLSEKDLVHISFTKGGYAFVLFGYIVNGNLSNSEFRHFFGMGAIFQLMDDLHDLKDDLKNGSDTIFTRHIIEGGKIDDLLCGLFEIQRKIESDFGLLPSFLFPSIMRFLEYFGFRYDTIRFISMQTKYISGDFMVDLKSVLPIEIDNLIDFYKNTITHERLDIFEKFIRDLRKITSENKEIL